MRTLLLLVLLVSGMALPQAAQSQSAPADTSKQFQFNFRFRFSFAPERVIENQRELGLSATQKQLVHAETLRAQRVFTEMQRRLDTLQLQLVAALESSHVDESAALATLDAILAHEAQLKRLQLQLLIRTKNVLTAEQQRLLTQSAGRD